MNGSGLSSAIAAFGEEHVMELTGLSKRQLRYWARTGFFASSFGKGDTDEARTRIYAFRDVAALRTIAVLRNEYKVSLQHLREVAEKLAHLGDRRWTATTLQVQNKKVVFEEPETRRPREVVSGQYVLGIKLADIISDLHRDAETLRRRRESDIGRIARRRSIAHNAAVFSGTRIHVDSVRRLHADGYTHEQILAEYPDLTKADIAAALDPSKAAA